MPTPRYSPDPYAGLPDYLRPVVNSNLQKADQSVSRFNTLASTIRSPASNSTATNPRPFIPAAPTKFTLNGAPDISFASPLPSSTTTTSQPASPAPSAFGQPPDVAASNNPSENFSGHMIAPQTPGLNGSAYDKTTFKPSQSYLDWQAKHEERKKQFGWSPAQQ